MASKIHEHLIFFIEFGGKIWRDCNLNKVHSYNFWIYVFSGFWKYESPKRWKTSLYNLYRSTIIFIYVMSFVFFVIDAVVVRNEFDKLSFNMSSTVLVLTKILQIILLSSLKEDIEEIYDKLENHLYVNTVGESDEDKRIMREKAETILKISLMFYGLLMMGLPLRVIADTALDTKAYIIPMPFKENIADYYDYVYAQQVFLSFHFMVTTLSYDLIGFSFIIRFIGHYEILGKNFQKLKTLYPKRNFEKYVRGYVENQQARVTTQDVLIRKTNYSEKMEKFVKKCKFPSCRVMRWTDDEKRREEKTYQLLKENINHHQKLLAGIRSYSDIYSRPLLIQICGMTILLGIAVVQAIFLSKGLNILLLQQVLYACTTLFNIFCLCSFGSELTSKSLSATHDLYDTPWYDMSISNRNAISLILQTLSQAPVLKGGGMIHVNRVTCVKYIQSSYNMVALLRNKI